MSYGKGGIRDKKLGVSTPMKKGTTHGKYGGPKKVPGDFVSSNLKGTAKAKGKGPKGGY